MKLTYRGISYEITPAQLTDARFHGANVRQNEKANTKSLNAVLRLSYPVQPAANVQSIPAGTTLKYRGVAYTTQPVAQPKVEAQPQVVAATQPALTFEEKARTLVQNHHRATKKRQQVLLSRVAHEVGLNTETTGYWTHIQGKIQPSFWAYDRSHVALS